jgi:tRNA pseudouridine65 synthase
MLDILFQDDHLVAIDKPSGLLVHRSPVDRSETRFALQLLRDQIGRRVYPVHRLDKPTSGVLLFGLTPGVAALLAAQFRDRAVGKRYLAVTRGHCPASGVIDHPIRDRFDPAIAARPQGAAPPARDAITRYRRLATAELAVAVDRYPTTRYSLVELEPLTGRRHQLRRHLKHLGYPIIGDAKYGKGVHNRFVAERWQCPRLLLACLELRLSHPQSGAALSLRAGLDPAFRRVVAALGWEAALPGVCAP